MDAYSYRELDVWELAQDLAANVVCLVKEVPKDLSSIEISKQLVRAGGSAPANIAEGHGRYTLAAYRNHLLIARGSVAEVGSWVDLLHRCEYISAEDDRRLSSAADSVTALLTVKARTLEKQIQAHRSRARS